MKTFIISAVLILALGSVTMPVCSAQNSNAKKVQTKQSEVKSDFQRETIQSKERSKVVTANSAPTVGKKDSVTVKITESFPGYTFNSFINFYSRGIQEKLYIQTDKPYYSAGEKLWFKGYLVNAVTNAPIKLSKFIYVELINRDDSLITRQKIKVDDYGFHNNITLEAALPQGEYVLRGYTKAMLDNDDKFFFSKKIAIANPIDDAVNSAVSYSKDSENNIVATVTMRNQSLDPIVAQKLRYEINVDGKSKDYNTRTNDNGKFTITFPQPINKSANNSITLISEDPSRLLNRTIFIPVFDDDFDLQFFPEGGHFIAGIQQNIAFKATGVDGLSRSINGKLFTASGELLSEFTTTHKGMGSINIQSEAGAKYYVEASQEGSDVVRKFELPPVVSTGCAINVVQLRGKIFYQLLLTPDIDPKNLGICIHSKGKIISAERVEPNKLSKVISIENLGEGISQIAVIDINTIRPIAQRALFIRKNGGEVSIATDKDKYSSRELVTLDLQVKDNQGVPAAGSFAVSVTDRNAVPQDSLAGDINSYLLLSSDIKGIVEDPTSYFIDDSPKTKIYLDLLMMVNGWTRFDMEDLMQHKIPAKAFQYESEQTFTGEVKGFFGNAAKTPTILVFNPKSRYFDMFPLGETNKFSIAGLDYPDSTSLIIQAVGKSGAGKTLRLDMKEPTYPKVNSYITPRIFGSHDLQLPQSFLSQSKERYYYEGGMRVIDMAEITVVHQEERRNVMYNMTPTRSMDKKTIEQYSSMSILDAVGTFPGVQVIGDMVSIRGSQDPPLVYVDEIPTDLEFVNSISMLDVETLDLVVGPEAGIFGLGASGGVILIGLKAGSSASGAAPPSLSLAKIKQLGYKKPEAFFQPKYEQPEKLNDKTPDLRTTICWNPMVVTDSTGVARVTFYTADKSSSYDVVIEGVTSNGSLVRNVAEIKRE